MADPRCPSCAVEGIRHIVSADSEPRARDGKPWFQVVHCDTCGHVYGVLAKHVFTRGGGPRLVLRERD
jgi:hypothetical protein